MSEFLTISAPNNRPDTNGLGCVPYAYDMAKYQLTNGEWCDFLNAVGYEKAMSLKLYHKDMGEGILGGIISRGEHVEHGESFICKDGWKRKPIVYIRHLDVCRYCNWLMTGDTERGCYDLAAGRATSMKSPLPRRLPGARYFIPTVDEWQKAAYYNPATRTYRQYPTGNNLPRLDQANYERGDEFSPIALTPTPPQEKIDNSAVSPSPSPSLSLSLPPQPSYFYLADVDAFADAPSCFGCIQMGGNAWELLEDVRIKRDGSRVNLYKGGSFGYTETGLSKSNTDEAPYNGRCYVFGVRIARAEKGWTPKRRPLKYDIILKMSTMKNIVKRVVMSLWHHLPKGWQNHVYWWADYLLWRKELRNACFLRRIFRGVARSASDENGRLGDRSQVAERLASPTPRPRLVVIVPCEPWSVIGSRGDEAMITAIIDQERRRDPQTEFAFITAGDTPEARLRFPFARFVGGWAGRLILRSVNATLRALSPDAVYCLGADCMDGKYSPRTSLILLGAAAYASACGAESHLTGFSFNEHPAHCLRRAFRTAASFLTFNLRDAVSAQRFERFTGVKPRLVADIAFLLSPTPSPATEKWTQWCNQERSAKRLVLGINLNPMLFPHSTRTPQITQIASQLTAILQDTETPANSVTMKREAQRGSGVPAACQKNDSVDHTPNSADHLPPPPSLLLIPHDYRDGGDPTCLELLYEFLHDSLKDNAHIALVRDVLTAPELKSLVGSLDALFTCRMHLGIAALGQGKPIAGFAYQGKFAGLFKHFNLPEELIGDATKPDQIGEILTRLIAHHDDYTQQVVDRLPTVSELAKLNTRCEK